MIMRSWFERAAFAALAALTWRLARRVDVLENYMLGVQYDAGLLAIALEDAGTPVRDDLRELAYHARRQGW
jgi:hypothetical protein